MSLGGAAVLLIAAGITAYLLIAAAHSPSAAVSRFLDLVEKGRSHEAVEVLSPAPDAALDLVDDDIYSATKHRITHYDILGTRTDGGSAQVRVRITTDRGSTTETFDLLSAHRIPVFSDWTVDGTSLPVIELHSDRPSDVDVTVNGHPVDTDKGTLTSYVALPGVYRFGIQSDTDTFVTADTHDVSIASLGDGTKSAELDVRLTSDGIAKARAAVDAFLAACTSQATLSPKGDCGLAVTPPTDGSTVSNIRWSIKRRPVVSFDTWEDGGWTVKTDTAGSIEMDADFRNAYGFGEGFAVFDPYDVEGYIDVADDGTLEFTSGYEGDAGNRPDGSSA
jgi:hypothetical protein